MIDTVIAVMAAMLYSTGAALHTACSCVYMCQGVARAGLPGVPGPYALQAAIAVCHARARTAQDTDWARIAALYGELARVSPSPWSS